MLTLIKSILKSLELFLSLKNKLFYFDLHNTTQEKQKMKSSNKSKILGRVGIVMMLIGLTSCAKDSSLSVPDLNIYQPSTLKLQKGKKILTEEGIYTPETDEVWHSDARFRRLERQIYYSK